MQDFSNLGERAAATMVARHQQGDSLEAPSMTFEVECRAPDGTLRWTETVENLVTTAGKTDLIDKYLKGSAYTAAWYLMLMGTGTPAVGDTLASHAGWAEVTPYSGNRPLITWGTTAAGSNTSSAVSYTINASATVAGAAVCNAASGTTGVLYNGASFGTSRSVISGDTLTVTMTLSAS